MEHETLFISDLHLSIEKPEITRRFVNFLDRRARKAQAPIFSATGSASGISRPLSHSCMAAKCAEQTAMAAVAGCALEPLAQPLHKSKKTAVIMDVNPQSVAYSLRKYRILRLIHGHTHRPGIHDLLVDGLSTRRFVLAEWKRYDASVLCWNAKNYRLESITGSME